MNHLIYAAIIMLRNGPGQLRIPVAGRYLTPEQLAYELESAMALPVELPSYQDAEERTKAGYGSALDKFIEYNEPAGQPREAKFREQLQAAIIEARRQGTPETAQFIADLVANMPPE